MSPTHHPERAVVPTDDAELEAVEAENERLLASIPDADGVEPGTPEYLRALREDTWWYEPQRSEATVGTIAGVPVRRFSVERPVATYLRIHGGGWVYGSASAEDQLSLRLAEDCGANLVSVDYRLAPESPWPAANDDCWAVARALLADAASGSSPGPVFIGGESSGAHLALGTALRARDHGLEGDVAGVNLVGGLYDLRGVPSIRQFTGRDPMGLSEQAVDWYVRCFVGSDDADLTQPEISPLWADLSGLPPVLISTAERDPLIDNSLFLAERLRDAGSPVRLDLYRSGYHAFEIMNSILADHFHGRVASWSEECL